MNREQIKYNQIWRLGFAVLLVALLTLSPCSVRNSIEQSLGLEKTSAINKSKSAEVKTGDCLVDNIHKNIIPAYTNPLTFTAALPENPDYNHFYNTTDDTSNFSSFAYLNIGIKIPLYILFNNFKFHL